MGHCTQILLNNDLIIFLLINSIISWCLILRTYSDPPSCRNMHAAAPQKEANTVDGTYENRIFGHLFWSNVEIGTSRKMGGCSRFYLILRLVYMPGEKFHLGISFALNPHQATSKMKHFTNETKPVTEIAYSEPEFNPYEYIIISSLWWKMITPKKRSLKYCIELP